WITACSAVCCRIGRSSWSTSSLTRSPELGSTSCAKPQAASVSGLFQVDPPSPLLDGPAPVVFLQAAVLVQVFRHRRDLELAADPLAAPDAQARFRYRLDPFRRDLLAAPLTPPRVGDHSFGSSLFLVFPRRTSSSHWNYAGRGYFFRANCEG